MGSNPVEKSWASSTGQVTVTWGSRGNDSSFGNGNPQSSGYQYDAQREATAARDIGRGNPASQTSTSNLVAGNTSQDYYGYASYTASNTPYAYDTSEYQNYYYGYQQPANESSSHQVGAIQNSGAPYQVLSSFQNSGSCVGSTSYSYNHAGDNQNVAAYQSSNINNQPNMWNDGNSGSYSVYQYPSNASSSTTNTTQSIATAPINTQYYPHHYNQWPGYYGYSAPVASSAPGTENASVTTGNTGAGHPPGVSGTYPYPSSQPPPPGTTSWRGDTATPLLQGKNDGSGYNVNSFVQVGAPVLQPHQNNQTPSYQQKPLEPNSLLHKYESSQNSMHSAGPNLLAASSNQVSERFQSPLQTAPTIDQRVSKMQIPTNPRIASSLPLPKVDNKESSTTNIAAAKPAYISVSVPKPSDKVSSDDDADAITKGAFPPSLRTYVERSFARCKNDAQRAGNQKLMKEMITRTSADGTLFTRNWDLEPLFSLPDASPNIADSSISSPIANLLPRRSQSRRTKSRWEPVPEEKPTESPSTNDGILKDVRWSHLKEHEKAGHDKKNVTSPATWNGTKFSSPQHSLFDKNTLRPVKKQRFSSTSGTTENHDTSNDCDEQSLTKYYSSAIALANSPEEKKRREYRFKRFDKGHERQDATSNRSSKAAGAGNLHIKRADALLFQKTYENGSSRAVEDIDWDALTVKGTCQDIEKRYLRLTSSPDPATVRPEEVLEKALKMVQSSEKNYLYKCDQLKSIRQDLTVQRIQNQLTVKVYETHARLALQAGDLPEYNQCQSQLKRLYAEGIRGSDMEFAAYNLLCVILHSNNKRDLLSSMTRLSSKAKEDEAVKHALAVRRAVSSGNYILFFRLYREAPNLSTYLMDLYVENMRFEAVKCMSKSYRPTVPVSRISRVLGFSRAQQEDIHEKNIDGLDECEEWLRAHGAILTLDNNGEWQLDTKASSSTLYMPEPEDAVAHGDANLAVDDFLTRAST